MTSPPTKLSRRVRASLERSLRTFEDVLSRAPPEDVDAEEWSVIARRFRSMCARMIGRADVDGTLTH